MIAAPIVGLAIGSFLNVVIHRLPRMMEAEWRAQCAELEGREPPQAGRYNLLVPRSHCPACNKPLRAMDNIPVVSYLMLRGKCAFCGARISPRYPIVEALTAVLSSLVAWRFGWGAAGALALVLLWALIALTFIDADTTFLPDDLTLPLLGLGIAGAGLGWTGTSLTDAAWGAFAGYGGLWLLAYSYRKLRGVEGMGEGDFKLLAGLGALLGWQLLPSIVLLASAVGAVVGIGLITLGGHRREVPIPFGPYLVGGGLAAIFFGRQLTALWFPSL